MAIAGRGGTLELSRRWPPPVAISDTRLISGTPNRLMVRQPAFWSGDHVLVVAPDGLLDEGGGTASPDQVIEAFIYRDEMDRSTFYTSELGALNRDPAQRIEIIGDPFGVVVLATAADSIDYRTELLAAANAITPGSLTGERALARLVSLPEVVTSAGETAMARGWRRQLDMGKWRIETDATRLDSSAIGEVFGDSVKSMLTGAGSYEGVLSNVYEDEADTGAAFIRLTALLQDGADGRLRARVGNAGQNGVREGQERTTVPLFYESDVLMFNCELNTSADDVATVTGSFVTVRQFGFSTGEEVLA